MVRYRVACAEDLISCLIVILTPTPSLILTSAPLRVSSLPRKGMVCAPDIYLLEAVNVYEYNVTTVGMMGSPASDLLQAL